MLDMEAQDAWARSAYDAILREEGDSSAIASHTADIERVDGRVGFTTDEINAIKQHLMNTEHLIQDRYTGDIEVKRFDVDPDIAEAWIRLRAGRHLPEDVVLLEHELAELTYMREHPGCTYNEAHDAANERHDWSAQVPPSRREDLDSEW